MDKHFLRKHGKNGLLRTGNAMKPFDPSALLRELDFERLAGTDGEARARDILVGELRDMGLEPAIEGFEVRSFEPGAATLEVGGERFDLVPHGLEGDRDLEGELAFLENADVLAFNRGAFRGKVVLAFTATGKAHEMASEAGVAAYVGDRRAEPAHSGGVAPAEVVRRRQRRADADHRLRRCRATRREDRRPGARLDPSGRRDHGSPTTS